MTTSTTQQGQPPVVDAPDRGRQAAIKRLEAKRKFRSDVFAYVVVNLFLVAAWALGGRGDFWPGWVLAGWGVFLLIDAYRVYLSAPITDAEVDREMQRLR